MNERIPLAALAAAAVVALSACSYTRETVVDRTHPAAVVWAAQMGTVTLHPWQVRCPDTDHPDELRIDLDPQPGVAFEQARTVAVDVLRPLLDELGLVGYPKTSGGRGIHGPAQLSSCGIERLPGLQGDVPVPGSVVAIADQTLALVGDHGVHRSCRDAPSGRHVDRDDVHDTRAY